MEALKADLDSRECREAGSERILVEDQCATIRQLDSKGHALIKGIVTSVQSPFDGRCKQYTNFMKQFENINKSKALDPKKRPLHLATTSE